MSNTGKKICLLGFLAAAGVAVAAGCSARVASSGTDSNTHWLDVCTSDAECGDLQCYCGVCTKPCGSSNSCSALGTKAICEERPFGCDVGKSVCLASCETGMDCPAGLRCEAGQCTVNPGTGANPIPDAGPPPAPQDGGGTHDPCAPMDARSSGLLCAGVDGFTWNGVTCEPIVCGCAGTDCDRIYPTAVECLSARAACNPAAPSLCDLPLSSGDCDGLSMRYGYSPEAGACVQFIYGLCGGNENNFPTLEACNTVCAARADRCSWCSNGRAPADCTPDERVPPASCAACPKSRSANGEPCTAKNLECVFLPACGATTCRCMDDGSGELVWQCIANLC